MKRSDILTPIGMLLGIGLIVFAISQGNVGLAGFYDLVSVIITVIIYGKEDLYGLSEIQPSAGIYQRVSDDTYRSSYG